MARLNWPCTWDCVCVCGLQGFVDQHQHCCAALQWWHAWDSKCRLFPGGKWLWILSHLVLGSCKLLFVTNQQLGGLELESICLNLLLGTEVFNNTEVPGQSKFVQLLYVNHWISQESFLLVVEWWDMTVYGWVHTQKHATALPHCSLGVLD